MSRHKRKALKFWCIYNNVACLYYFWLEKFVRVFCYSSKIHAFSMCCLHFYFDYELSFKNQEKSEFNKFNDNFCCYTTLVLFCEWSNSSLLQIPFSCQKKPPDFFVFFSAAFSSKVFFLLLNLKYSCYRVVVCCSWFTKITSVQIFLPHYSQWFQFYFCNFLMVVFEGFF